MNDRKVPLALTEAERERAEHVDRLASQGGVAVPGLLDMLVDPSWSVRRAVVAALGALGDDAIAPLCQTLVHRRDDEARIAAVVDALVASISHAEPAVIALADDPNPAVVADVAQILGRRRSPEAIPTLAKLTRHLDDNVTASAIEALGRVGGRAAVDSLVAAAESNNFFRAFPAIDVLGRSGDPRAVVPLAALLDQPHFTTEAARALGRTGDRAAVAPLAALLSRSADAMVRLAALALADLCERQRERHGSAAPVEDTLRKEAPPLATRRLLQALDGADAGEQVATCRVLGALGSEDAVPALTRLLDAAPAIAAAAADALQRVARQSDAQLLKAIREGDSVRRAVLLPLVARASATEETVACLVDADARVRALACEALARIGNPACVRALFPLLSDPNPRVVQAAIGAIQSLGSPETESLALFLARSPMPPTRRAVLSILSYFGYASAMPIFVEAVRDPDPRIRDTAIYGLPFIDHPSALETLLALSEDTADRTRAAAMRAFGQCTSSPRIVERLMHGLSDRDAWARYYACQSLGKLRTESAVGAIAALLADDAGQVRVAAIESLSHLRNERAFEALQGAASAEDRDVQRAALLGLGMSRRPDAVPVLVAAAASPDAATRLVATSAIAAFEGAEALGVLERAAVDNDENVRHSAIGFLAGASGVAPTRVLISLLRPGSSVPTERVLAALALPAAGRVPALVESLSDADDEQAPLIVSAIARMQRPEAESALADAMALPNAAARKAVAATLAAKGTRESLEILKRAAISDTDPEVRRIASLLLAR